MLIFSLFTCRLLNVKALGESDDESENDTAAWVNRNREIIKQKEEAAKRVSNFLFAFVNNIYVK